MADPVNFLKARLKSFSFAFAGIRSLFRSEPNAWIHLCGAIVVVCAGIYFPISKTKWSLLIVCIAAVFFAEMMNTAVEKLCDLVHPEQHPQVKFIKDVAAGAVLVVAIMAAIIGTMIFLPYLR